MLCSAINYKKQRNLVVKINNECKRGDFDKLNRKKQPNHFRRLGNHTSETHIHTVASNLY